MRIPFSLYDFLGYAGPGFIAIVIIVILVYPTLLVNFPNELKDEKSVLSKILTPNVVQGVFYLFACHFVGVASHGVTEWTLRLFTKRFRWAKRLYSDQGMFEEELFKSRKSRRYFKDIGPYSDQFVSRLKEQVEKVFNIKVDEMETGVEYTEIFHLCRNTVIKHNPTLYSGAFVFLVRYSSTKLLGCIFFLGGIGFLMRAFLFRPPSLEYWFLLS